MPRRSDTPAEREARDRVKQRYDAQLEAINEFFTRERRIDALRVDFRRSKPSRAMQHGGWPTQRAFRRPPKFSAGRSREFGRRPADSVERRVAWSEVSHGGQNDCYGRF